MPALAISETLIRPEPKIIAFGGVATGSINANDAEIVAGIIKYSGLTFIAVAIEAKIGSSVWVVAVFDVSSVKNVSVVEAAPTNNIVGAPAKDWNSLPTTSDKPEL